VHWRSTEDLAACRPVRWFSEVPLLERVPIHGGAAPDSECSGGSDDDEQLNGSHVVRLLPSRRCGCNCSIWCVKSILPSKGRRPRVSPSPTRPCTIAPGTRIPTRAVASAPTSALRSAALAFRRPVLSLTHCLRQLVRPRTPPLEPRARFARALACLATSSASRPLEMPSNSASAVRCGRSPELQWKPEWTRASGQVVREGQWEVTACRPNHWANT
jgi:hypothetical protein